MTLRNRYKNAFSQIDVQLKRRYDLIPNLIEVAKGYMAHERDHARGRGAGPNQAVAAQQKAAANPGDPAAMSGLSAADGQVSGVLGRLFALAESYPDLKANQNMLALQEELTSTENKVAFARQSFNDAVMNYNTQREVFPASVIAALAGFRRPSSSRSRPPRNARHPGCRSDRRLEPGWPGGRTSVVPERSDGRRARKAARGAESSWIIFRIKTSPASEPACWFSCSSRRSF